MSFLERPRCRVVAIAAMVAASSATPFARGQVGTADVVERVVIKPGTVFRIGDRVVEPEWTPRIYEVTRADGEWRWLTSPMVKGWAKASDVVPLDRAIAETVEALVRRADALASRKQYTRAISDYDEALRLDRGHLGAFLGRGVARQAIGDLWLAIADYDRAIEGGLKTARTYEIRGYARELERHFDDAIADYSEAIRLDPGSSLAWSGRGDCWKSKGAFDKALADSSEAIYHNPRSPWGYALQASIFSTSGVPRFQDAPRAVELARKACDLGGTTNAYLCEVRANAHAAAGEADLAQEWRTRAVRAKSNDPAGQIRHARVRHEPDRGTPSTAGPPVSEDGPVGYLSSIPRDYLGTMPRSAVLPPQLQGRARARARDDPLMLMPPDDAARSAYIQKFYSDHPELMSRPSRPSGASSWQPSESPRTTRQVGQQQFSIQSKIRETEAEIRAMERAAQEHDRVLWEIQQRFQRQMK